MRLVGPNCFGVAVPGLGLDATFAVVIPPGAPGWWSSRAGSAWLCWSTSPGSVSASPRSPRSATSSTCRATTCCSGGPQDGTTRLAVLYLESFGNPRKFARTAAGSSQQMPVLTVHAGRSAAGQRAAASHTAAAATPLITRQALFEQAGIIATDQLRRTAGARPLLAEPAGRRAAGSRSFQRGRRRVLAADACVEAGLVVPRPADPPRQRLAAVLPPGAAVAGPVNTTAAVTAGAFPRHWRSWPATPGSTPCWRSSCPPRRPTSCRR